MIAQVSLDLFYRRGIPGGCRDIKHAIRLGRRIGVSLRNPGAIERLVVFDRTHARDAQGFSDDAFTAV